MRASDVPVATASPVSSDSCDPGVVPEDSYAAQLDLVRRLGAAGASSLELRSAAQRLKELKRATYDKLPAGTVGRRKKRRAGFEVGVEVLDERKAWAKRDAPAVVKYPPVDFPPTDPDGFITAFDVPSECWTDETHTRDDTDTNKDAKTFFDRYGFVVFKDVLSRARCSATRNEIFSQLEGIEPWIDSGDKVTGTEYKKFNRHDYATYDALSSITYGLAPEPAVFTPQIVRNRVDANVARCLSCVLRLPDFSASNLLVSQDRWCVFRPTKAGTVTGATVGSDASDPATVSSTTVSTGNITGASTGNSTGATRATGTADGAGDTNTEDGAGDKKRQPPNPILTADRPEWRTRGNLHLDLNPWTFGGLAGGNDEETKVKNEKDDTESRDTRESKEPEKQTTSESESVADALPFASLRDFSRETNCVSFSTGPHCQGVLNLLDNLSDDGGLTVVPGFHRVFDDWVDVLGGDEGKKRYAETHDDWRLSRLVVRNGGAGSFKFGDDDVAIHARAVRVTAREGSFVLW